MTFREYTDEERKRKRQGLEPLCSVGAGYSGQEGCTSERPCTRFACKFHLWPGHRERRDGVDPEGSCTLDFTGRAHEVWEIAKAMGMCRDSANKILLSALAKVRRDPRAWTLLRHLIETEET